MALGIGGGTGGGGGGGGGVGGTPLIARGIGGVAKAPAFDLSGTAIGQILGILNNPGTLVGGSGGVSNAGARAASTAAYNQAEANRANVYGQAVSSVQDRNPGIQQSYTDATAALQANARQRAIDDASRQATLQQQATQGAQALGLSGVAAPSATTRTNATDAAQQTKYQTNADSWAGYNAGASQRAVASNNAVADAFTWQGAQQQAALSALLQRALASEQDRGGSAPHLVGAPTTAQQLAGYENLLGYSSKDFNNNLAASKFQQATNQATISNNLKAATAKTRYGVTVPVARSK